MVENALRGSGADAWQQVHHAETGDAVTRILDEPQQRKDVLHMRGVEKLQTAEFHERNVATGEFDLQRATVRGCAEKHRLLLEEGASFAVFQNALYDVARLVGLVAYGDQLRAFCRLTSAPSRGSW